MGSYPSFLFLSNFALFLYFVPNVLSMIVGQSLKKKTQTMSKNRVLHKKSAINSLDTSLYCTENRIQYSTFRRVVKKESFHNLISSEISSND